MNTIFEETIKKRESFFDDYWVQLFNDTKGITIVAVMHIIDTAIPYYHVLDKHFDLACIIPKPNSINQQYLHYFPKEKLLHITRDELIAKRRTLIDRLNAIPSGNKVILLDIGGYFASILKYLHGELGEKLIGVIEDTENGYQKYLALTDVPVPVISVARSPLKSNEDFLVGQAVVFSAEALLRGEGMLLNNKKTGLIGFGKIGNGILSSLRDKGCDISVYDKDAIVLLQASSKGYKILPKHRIIEEADIIFCATGNMALKGDDFKFLKNGAFIASVTSSDDELDISYLKDNYRQEYISEHIDRYDRNGHYFYLLNKGNPINFIHGAILEDYILLVQKEMIDTAMFMSHNNVESGLQNGIHSVQGRVADAWLKYFKHLNV